MKRILLLLLLTTSIAFAQSAQLDTNVAQRLNGTSNGYFTGSNITGSWNFQAFGAPTVAPVAGTPSAGGSCTAGTHSYKVTFATVAGGESTPSVKSNVITCVTTTGQTVGLSGIPAGPPGTTARKLYRTAAGDAGSYLLLATISDNTTTTYSDTIADASLGAAAPSSDTTAVANIQTGGVTALTIDSNQNALFVNSGVFTNTQMNQSLLSNVNSLDFKQEFQIAQGTNYSTDGFAAGVNVPNTASVYQANGVSGYVVQNGSSIHAAVAGNFIANAKVNSSNVFGVNSVAEDVSGLTSGVVLTGMEVDTGAQNAITSYNGLFGVTSVIGGTATSWTAGSRVGGSAAFKAGSNAVPQNRAWAFGYATQDLAVTDAAFIAGALCASSGTCNSQPLQFNSYNSGAQKSATIYSDNLGNVVITSPNVKSKRYISSGTALVAGDFALSAGWGSTASIGTITGTDQAWQATVTSSGTGQGTNPTITLTFKDGTWTNAPICITKDNGGTGVLTNAVTEAPTATTNVITYNGLAVSGSTYIFSSICMGR